MAAYGIRKLSRDPLSLAYVRKIDVLFLEEVGMICCEQYCAMDLIFQHLRGNRLPFGGVLLIGTGDPRQLRPPNGSLIWMSTVMLTTFKIHTLSEFVRMDRNGDGQRLLTLMASAEIDSDVAQQITQILSESCNFVTDWDSVIDRPGVIRIFGTRSAEREAVDMVLSKIEGDNSIMKFFAYAIDHYTTTGTTNWKPGNLTTTKLLNSRALEPQKLILYQFAPLRLTVKNLSEGYTQGQLCLVKSIPSNSHSMLEVYLSPYGNRDFPADPSTFHFIENGWKIVKLYPTLGHVFGAFGMSVRRTQYPVKHFFAATIHKTMGETLHGVITKVSLLERKYSLWEKEQIYVLVSRVRSLSNVTFVGEKCDTLEAIKAVLMINTQWSRYIDHFLDQIVQRTAITPVFEIAKTEFEPYCIEIPRHSVGYVYLLISRVVEHCIYVGETENLRRRLKEHNSGMGASFTNVPERRPWAVFSFITGFENIDDRKRCEGFWHKELFDRFKSKGLIPTALQAHDVGLYVVAKMRDCNPYLNVVICGRLKRS